MRIELAVALFKLITAIIRLFERQHWYQEGRDAANKEANEEQLRRIEAANAARADAEHIDAGGVPDPRQRD
jgi:hypothetical protein